jgi:hypothetical protein
MRMALALRGRLYERWMYSYVDSVRILKRVLDLDIFSVLTLPESASVAHASKLSQLRDQCLPPFLVHFLLESLMQSQECGLDAKPVVVDLDRALPAPNGTIFDSLHDGTEGGNGNDDLDALNWFWPGFIATSAQEKSSCLHNLC